jgi:hypothetical protein
VPHQPSDVDKASLNVLLLQPWLSLEDCYNGIGPPRACPRCARRPSGVCELSAYRRTFSVYSDPPKRTCSCISYLAKWDNIPVELPFETRLVNRKLCRGIPTSAQPNQRSEDSRSQAIRGNFGRTGVYLDGLNLVDYRSFSSSALSDRRSFVFFLCQVNLERHSV